MINTFNMDDPGFSPSKEKPAEEESPGFVIQSSRSS